MSASPSQSNRPIRFLPPKSFAPDVLLLRRFRLRDGLSQPFELVLDLQSLDHDIDLEELIGTDVNVEIDLPTNLKRYLNGMVLTFEQLGFDQQFANYRAVVVPWFAMLRESVNCEIFLNLTAPQIVKQIFKNRGFSNYDAKLVGLMNTYPVIKQCVQYNESDFNFVSRLLEEVGIFYYFEHQRDSCKMILSDALEPTKAMPGYGTIPYNPEPPGQRIPEHIYEWSIKNTYEPRAFSVTGYNFEFPKRESLHSKLIGSHPVGPDLRRYEFEDFSLTPDFTEEIAGIRAEELTSEGVRQTGKSDALGLAVGFHFTMSAFPRRDQNKEYRVTSLDWTASSSPFTTPSDQVAFSSVAEFGALDAKIGYRPPLNTPKKRIAGTQTAVVVGAPLPIGPPFEPTGTDAEVLTNAYGSVLVQFPWVLSGPQGAATSCWARVSQIWAGKGWGAMFIPHVNDEVIISFEHGDPSRPVVVGRVYNPQMPPAANPSENPNITSIQDVAGNYLRFDATSGSEEISMFTPNNSTQWSIGPQGVAAATQGAWSESVTDQKVSNVFGLSWNFVAGLYTKLIAGVDFGLNLIGKLEFVEAWAVKCTALEETKTSMTGQFIAYPKKWAKVGSQQEVVAEVAAVINDKSETVTNYNVNAAAYNLTTTNEFRDGDSSKENWQSKNVFSMDVTVTAADYLSIECFDNTQIKGGVSVSVTAPIVNLG